MNQTMRGKLLQAAMQHKDILLSAAGAFIRGESPVDWIKKVAKANPQLQKYNLDSLEALDATAAQVCQESKMDQNELTQEIKEFANSYINK